MRNPFAKAPDASLQKLNREMAQKIAEERNFWETCIYYALNEDDTADAAYSKAVTIADMLLEERKKRFP